jgi:hypothetical protein
LSSSFKADPSSNNKKHSKAGERNLECVLLGHKNDRQPNNFVSTPARLSLGIHSIISQHILTWVSSEHLVG